MKTIKIILVLAVLAGSMDGWCAPAISGLSGTVSNGETITISGSGFGTKTAAPLISSYDNATPTNNFVNMTAGNAPGGSWEYRDATVIAESAILRRTALDQASKYVQCPLLHGSPYSFLLYSSGESGSTFYTSFWIYYDMPAWNIGGSGANSKFWRHYVAGANCASWYIRVLSGAGNYVDYAGLGADYAEDDETYENHWTYMGYSQWIHVEIYEYVGTVNGNDGFVRTLINGRAVSNWTNGLLNNNHSPATPAITNNQHCWGQVSGPAYGDNDVLISEVYLDNTPARVFISSKNDITGNWWAYNASAHNEIQVPSTWSTSEIQVTVNRGTFGATDTAYLYVVDSDGAISPAYEITFGDTEAGSPAPPTLSFYLTNPSGSGAAQGSPHNSLGGYRSTTQVSASAMKNLFDDVTVAESIVGDTEYRFLDVYNSGDSSATKVQVFVSSDTTSSGTEITLGYNSTNQPHEDSWDGEDVANEDTAPADPSLTFGTYTRASPLHLGTIPAGRSVRICVKRTVTAGVPWTARDVGTIAVRYLGD